MYSSQEELDNEIENMERMVQRAQDERRNMEILKNGIHAQDLLPHLHSFRQHCKLPTVQEMKNEIQRLRMELTNIPNLRDRLPAMERINSLVTKVGDEDVTSPTLEQPEARSSDAVTQPETEDTVLAPANAHKSGKRKSKEFQQQNINIIIRPAKSYKKTKTNDLEEAPETKDSKPSKASATNLASFVLPSFFSRGKADH